MQNLKSEKLNFQDALKNSAVRLFPSLKIEPSRILQTLIFLSLGILSWLGFSYLLILYIKILQGGSLTNFPWHSDAPVWNFKYCLTGGAVIILVRWKFNLLSEKSKHIGRDFFILVSLLPVIAVSITGFTILMLGISYTGKSNPDSYDWVMGSLHGFILQIFVGFTCIGYFYLKLVNETKERLMQAQRAQAEMELKNLQQNIEPHFLFNNLNVLSSLIKSNPNKADSFLSKLAEIYRYILRTQTLEVVPARDEVTFAKNYIYLLRERFGNAYNFVWEVPENKLNGQMIVPVALQTLLENSVKHNAGNQQEPLTVHVRLGEASLLVENEIRAKSHGGNANSSGTGLQNLAARYEFLTEERVEISRDENRFAVKIPLLKLKK